jgi:hypothetical protein
LFYTDYSFGVEGDVNSVAKVLATASVIGSHQGRIYELEGSSKPLQILANMDETQMACEIMKGSEKL